MDVVFVDFVVVVVVFFILFVDGGGGGKETGKVEAAFIEVVGVDFGFCGNGGGGGGDFFFFFILRGLFESLVFRVFIRFFAQEKTFVWEEEGFEFDLMTEIL